MQGGGSLREHLIQVSKSTGFTPDELIAFEMPEEFEYIWEWFLDLSSTRSIGGGFVPIILPVTHVEILAWAQLNQRELSPYEVRIIKTLDGLYTKLLMTEQKNG